MTQVVAVEEQVILPTDHQEEDYVQLGTNHVFCAPKGAIFRRFAKQLLKNMLINLKQLKRRITTNLVLVK